MITNDGVLVRVNRITQQVEPALAVSWKILEGGRAIRFQLRDNVCFSDGTPFTSESAAAAWATATATARTIRSQR